MVIIFNVFNNFLLFQQLSVLCYHFYIHFIITIFLNIKDKQFTSSRTWKQHYKDVHFQVKPYKCKTCDKAFQYESELGRHVLLHAEKKPYQCQFCEEAFT